MLCPRNDLRIVWMVPLESSRPPHLRMMKHLLFLYVSITPHFVDLEEWLRKSSLPCTSSESLLEDIYAVCLGRRGGSGFSTNMFLGGKSLGGFHEDSTV